MGRMFHRSRLNGGNSPQPRCSRHVWLPCERDPVTMRYLPLSVERDVGIDGALSEVN